MICIASLLLEDWVKEAVSENGFFLLLVLLPGLLALKEHSWAWLSKTAGKGEMIFQVQPDVRIRKYSRFAFSEPLLSSSMPSLDTLLPCTHRHMALSRVGALFLQHPETAWWRLMATRCDIPQAVLLSTRPGQRAGRFLHRGGSGCSVYSLFWLKHHKAAFSLSKQHR